MKSGADTTTYSYFANGNRESMAYPNGVVAEYTYYADNRLHTLANRSGNTLLSTFNYAYDGNGNMLTKLENKGTTEYDYDVLGRLEQVTEPDGKVTAYAFDAAGNRTTETVTVDNSVTITEYNYNEQNRLLSAVETSDEAEKTTSFQYDNNGNEISRLVSTISDGNASPGYGLSQPGVGAEDEIAFELSGYDAFGRLVSVFNDNYAASYKYNADGLRSSKTVTEDGVTSTTKYLYNSGCIVLELDGTGAQTAFNIFGGSSVISRETAQGTDYYLYNGHGDVVQLTNSVGNVTATYDYDAFGNLLTITNHPNPFRYCGEYWDYETKRYYFRARYYSPKTGRFTQRDKFRGFYTDPLSLNRYTYGHNNPIKYHDPTGYYVSPTDQANLTSSQIAGIQAATIKYDNAPAGPAGDQQRKEANAEANAIRATAGYSGGGSGNSISISSSSTVQTININATTTINNRGTIATVNVLTGASSALTNSGTIGTINNNGTIGNIYNSGTVGTINNNGTIITVNNSGTIGNIYNNGDIRTINNNKRGNIGTVINSVAIVTVSNNGIIKTISNNDSGSVGKITNSGTIRTVSNSGAINSINYISKGSVGLISNSNTIVSISAGKSTTTIIDNSGSIGSIVTGTNSVVGVNNTGTINGIILGLGSIKLTNVKNDINIPLGGGWSYRYEVGDPNNPGNSTHMHLFQPDGKQSYSQKEDGSPKDGPKGGSGPPNSIMKKLKNTTGWDWGAKDKEWLSKIEMSYDPAGYTFIKYPDGRNVTVYQPPSWLNMSYYLNDQALKKYYFGSTYIDLSSGNTYTNPSGPYFIPIPNPGPVYIPIPGLIPAPLLT